jgi:O-antigen ligase
LRWRPDNAHNGYLDLWLQLGLLGVVIFAASFLKNLFKAVTLVRRENSWISMFPLLFLTFLMIHNITESTILFRNQIFWILYTLTSVQLRASAEQDICHNKFIQGE